MARLAQGPSILLRRLTNSQQAFVNKYDLCFVGELGVNGKLWWGEEYYTFPGGPRRSLAGTKLLVCGKGLDVRSFTLYQAHDNKELGTVSVGPKWSGTAHSLWARDLAKGLPGSDFSLMAADMTNAIRDELALKVAAGTAPAYQLNRFLDEQSNAMARGERLGYSDMAQGAPEEAPSERQSAPLEADTTSMRSCDPLLTDDVKARLSRLRSSY